MADGAIHLEMIGSHRLTLLVAPVASESRALLRAWAASRPRTAAWIRLTDADNAPERFLVTLIEGWQEICAEVRTVERDLPLELGIVDLLNALLSLPQDAVLVLEDYDVIETAEIHEALAQMLDYLPPRLHLVIVSREAPPLPNLPRLRVRRQLWRIETAQGFRSESAGENAHRAVEPT